MTTSRERTGLSPDKTPDWFPESLRLAPGEQVAKIQTSSDGVNASGNAGVKLLSSGGMPLPMPAAVWESAPHRRRLLVFGCSIAQQCNAYLAATTSTVTGGDIKAGGTQITVANGALYTVGNGIGVPLYNARIWQTTITAIAGNVLTVADKIPGLIRNGSAVTIYTSGKMPSLKMGYGAINAAVALLGGPVEVMPTYGYGGAIFQQMYCDLERDLRYYRPQYVALHMYENDICGTVASGSASLEQFKGWARIMAKMCLSYGAIPIVCSSMPYYNCSAGTGIPASRTADFDGLLDYLCKPVTSDGLSQLQLDVPGSYGMDLSTPWLDPDFVNDASFARRPIYAKLTGGALTAGEQAISNWTAITSGGFQITISGVAKNITGLNFSGAADLNAVAAIIKTALGSWGLCNWDATNGRFVIRTPETITYATAASSGTDISAMLKLTSATAASIGQGWTDYVHPLPNKRFGVGQYALPVLSKILPPAQSLADFFVTNRETSMMTGNTGSLSGMQAGSVAPKNHTVVAWSANVVAATSKTTDGTLRVDVTWPVAASRNTDYFTDRHSFTFPTVWAGSTQRFRVVALMRIYQMVGISQVLASAQIYESGTARELHTSDTGLNMCETIPADGRLILLETPLFQLGELATSVNLTIDVKPVDSASPANAVFRAEYVALGMLPGVPEVPHSYV